MYVSMCVRVREGKEVGSVVERKQKIFVLGVLSLSNENCKA